MFIIYTYLSVSDEPQKGQNSTSSQHYNRFQINLLAVKPFGIISDSQSKANCFKSAMGQPKSDDNCQLSTIFRLKFSP